MIGKQISGVAWPVMPCLIALGLCGLLAGCANQLSKAAASSVIENALAQRRASGMPNLVQGSIELQVGDVRGASTGNNCRGASSQPVEIAQLTRYDSAQVIHLDRPEPCKWVVTLSPQAQRDMPFDDTMKPPTARDYNTVSIALSQWSGFEVTGVVQDGMRADTEAVFHYRFTDTMHQLARAGVFPRLRPGCAYDTRNGYIRCSRRLAMTFVEGAWRLDLAVID